MRLKNPFNFGSLKLHTKTTIFISAVLIAVFAVIAYFYDEFTTNISTSRELALSQLAAHNVADIVEHHIKKKIRGKERSQDEESFEPDWLEVRDNISDTVMKR